ncbi:MAG: PAS domain S-box protein [Vicinamibacteria bacterium]
MTDPVARIAELVQAIQAAEAELQQMMGGQLDAVVTPDRQPYLLRDAQEKLRDSEAAHRSLAETQVGILNALPAHIALLDGEGLIIVVNDAWRHFASANVLQSPDFFVGQNYIRVCEAAQGECSEESQAVARGIRQVLSGAEKMFALEYPCHSPTEKRWFRLMVTPLNDQPGAGAVVMHVNVTERRMAEDALREREQEQRRLAETLTKETRRLHESQAVANVGSWETNFATLEIAWTEETYRIFEVSPAEFQPTYPRFLELVHPDDRAKLDAAFVNSRGRPDAVVIEHRICLSDGRVKFVEERWQSFNDDTGQPVRAVGTCQDITEEVKSETKLAESQRRYRNLVETSHDLIYSVSPQGQILFVNEASRSALGYAPEEMIGRDWVDFMPADRREQDLAVFAKILESGESHVDYTAHVLHKDGSTVVIRANSRALLDDAGQAIGRIGNARDVTQSVRAEDQLRQNQTLLRIAGSAAKLGGWSIDLPDYKVTWSDETAVIHDLAPGYTPSLEEAISFYPPEYRASVSEAVRLLTTDGVPFDFEHELITARQRRIWVRSIGGAHRDDAGQIIGIHGAFQDITERRKAEEQIRQLSQAVEQSPVATVITDRQGNIEYVNDVFLKTTGYTRAEIEGASPRLLKGGETPPDVYRQLWETITSGRTWRGEFHNRKKNGEMYWESAIISPVLAPSGQVTHFLALKEDITERKKAEAATKQIVQIQQELAMSDQKVQALMELIAERARQLTGATGSVVELADGAEMVYIAGAGVLADKVGLRLKREGSLSGLAVKTNSVLKADDTETDSRCDRAACRQVGVRAMVVAPLMREGNESLGVLKVMSDRPAAFTDREADNLQILTETLGAVIQRQRAADKLLQTAERLDRATHAGGLGVWDWDVQADHLVWDDRLYQIYGLRRKEFSSASEAWTKTVHPDDLGRRSAEVQAALRGEKEFNTEFRVVWPDGTVRYVYAVAQVVRDEDGRPVRMTGFSSDITERKLADLNLERANRALKMLSACNEALVRAENEADLLAAFCRLSGEIGGYSMTWVGYAQNDAARTISYEARSGDQSGYLDKIQLSWDETVVTGKGLAGRVIRSGQPVVSSDLETDDQFIPWRELALKEGLRSVICLPLRTGERTFGLLGLYSSEVNHPGVDEIKLLQEMADDLSFGIVNLRSQQDRRRMEAAVMRVATSVSASISEGFFTDLAVSVAEALDAQGAFVARLLPGKPEMAQTVAAVVDGKVVDNFDYPLLGSPCEIVTGRDSFIVPAHVAEKFPLASPLALFGAQAYVGRRLANAEGQTVGWLFVLFRDPLEDSGFVVSTLQIFATRAAGEFERLKADTRIREQAALLDKATDAILVRDLEHRLVYWNRGAEKMYGWSAADALGKPTPDLLYPNSALFHAAIAVVMDRGEWTGELEKKNRAGTMITVECRWTLVRSASGVPESILCIETDITERKKLEAQFLRAQRMESVGTLASGIAHDMNNILSPIMMSVELLKDDAKNEETLGLLNTLESCSRRGANLVQQLLSFARGVEGQRIEVNLKHLLKELQSVMQEVFPKDVRFSISAVRDLWTIVGDPSQLHQVLLNLCVNARDAMPLGGELTIAMENIVLDEIYAAMNPDGRTGAYVVITVTDTGTGMPHSVMGKIFEPFFTTKEQGKGTGLGLSTVIGSSRPMAAS